MKYIDEFRDKKLITALADKIKEAAGRKKEYRFMEVCGTHTMAIARFGLKSLLPENIKLLSGPGCPVCVTPKAFIDKAIAYSGLKDTLIATFGDMLKVPGSTLSLEGARSKNGNVKVVYSTMDALKIALDNPDKNIVFLGIGFETTTPTIAAAIKEARDKKIKNFTVLCNHKTMPLALRALITDERLKLDGFVLPAHVSAVIGSRPYEFIAEEFKIPCAIAGFEPLDIMQGIYMLIKQVLEQKPRVEIQYNRVVHPEGNKLAKQLMQDVFRVSDSEWRGLGIIPNSGLAIKKEFLCQDAENRFRVKMPNIRYRDKGCMCGEILKGIKQPKDCRLFAKACTPEHPVGPCMVSSEGACSARYLYR